MEWVKNEKCVLEMEKGRLKKKLQRADNFRRAEGRQICWLKLNEKMRPRRAPRRKAGKALARNQAEDDGSLILARTGENAAEMKKAENERLKNEYKADLERQNEMKCRELRISAAIMRAPEMCENRTMERSKRFPHGAGNRTAES
ncbi:hypothetical protein WR25_26684 [Diploscapter pachys]|uniref:Uncharacterized protein n=1 Tax=Diploscapter pachys TaxID=2018661 RepID=A0A2A2L8U0_9BILA|nr:hypothetical protein WR25_26684 [Diploscapter pachys]